MFCYFALHNTWSVMEQSPSIGVSQFCNKHRWIFFCCSLQHFDIFMYWNIKYNVTGNKFRYPNPFLNNIPTLSLSVIVDNPACWKSSLKFALFTPYRCKLSCSYGDLQQRPFTQCTFQPCRDQFNKTLAAYKSTYVGSDWINVCKNKIADNHCSL